MLPLTMFNDCLHNHFLANMYISEFMQVVANQTCCKHEERINMTGNLALSGHYIVNQGVADSSLQAIILIATCLSVDFGTKGMTKTRTRLGKLSLSLCRMCVCEREIAIPTHDM